VDSTQRLRNLLKPESNKVLAIIIGMYGAIRLGFMYCSSILYKSDTRLISGPPVGFWGNLLFILPSACTMVMAIGLYHGQSWWILACLAGMVGTILFSLFLYPLLEILFIPIIAVQVFLRATRNTGKKSAVPIASSKPRFPKRKFFVIKAIILATITAGVVLVLPFQVTTGDPLSKLKYNTVITPGTSFKTRQQVYLNASQNFNDFGSQAVRVFLGLPANELAINKSLSIIRTYQDTMDFTLNGLLRIIYLDQRHFLLNGTHVLSSGTKANVEDALIKCKYWFTEPGNDSAIFWTENHQIMYHTAELLVGQLFPAKIFPNSGMTGLDHVTHATPLILQWLDWKAKFGFDEWYSDVYYNQDITALVNLVDFSSNPDIATRASMILDLIAFEFANNYYNGTLATTQGRTYDDKVRGQSATYPADIEDITEGAWLLANVGGHHPDRCHSTSAVALATSIKYATPPVIEAIAANASQKDECMEHSGIGIDDGSAWNISYDENNLMLWWGMAGPVASPVIDTSFQVMNEYHLNPGLVCGTGIPELLEAGATLRGISLHDYSTMGSAITEGLCLDTANIYTYRTPHYQLSAVQHRRKGQTGLQELYWQASLDQDAVVYTNAPGGLGFRPFTGGWKPRTTFYKNVGVIQYDRASMPLEMELAMYLVDGSINDLYGNRPYTHAYFPQWASDEVRQAGSWTFGKRGSGYIALFSDQPTSWASNYDLQALGKKNVYIVELGSADESGSFDHFVQSISNANVNIVQQSTGYSVAYTSPSQGLVTVSWDGPMVVNGTTANLGPYPRFQNPYCTETFGSHITTIQFNNQSLVLDFNAGTITQTP